MLTEEGKNDPSVPPAILIEHVQRCHIFLANLFGIIDQFYCFEPPEIRSQVYLVLAISTRLGVARVV